MPRGYRKTAYRRAPARKTGPTPEEEAARKAERDFVDGVVLGAEQRRLFERIESGNDHFFVTGRAGTGKSVLLQYLKHKSRKKMVVGAFTGVSALNVGGQTLHSLFLLPFGFVDLRALKVPPRMAEVFKSIDMFVIDEISMVRADVMGAVDYVLRKARGNDAPFGGVQMVLFGDPYQLPPVVENGLEAHFEEEHGGPYFFNAHVWARTPLRVCELREVFRQKGDPAFAALLDRVRRCETDGALLAALNARVGADTPPGTVTLAARNWTADALNASKLGGIGGREYEYACAVTGDMDEKSYPADAVLKLREGAQVMLLVNDPERRWVNGTVGEVARLSENEVCVRIGGNVWSVRRHTWSKIRYAVNGGTGELEEEVQSSFTQYPLRLAWAITVHKAQGKTYDAVRVDFGGGAFAHGQAYVALSRCTSLGGLSLVRPLRPSDFRIDPRVAEFMESAEIESAD